jgi:hypothetical protein
MPTTPPANRPAPQAREVTSVNTGSSDLETDEAPTPLAELIEGMKSVHMMESTADKAFQNTWFLKLIGLPALALVFGWDSGWSVLALPIVAIFVSAILAEILKGMLSFLTESRLGLVVSYSLAHVLVGGVFYFAWSPHLSIPVFYGALIIIFIVAFAVQQRLDQIAANKLGLSARLREELSTLTQEPLHPSVDVILQRVARERGELNRVLADSLATDGAIDSLGIQREYDAGFADLLDRAHPLSILQSQAESGSEIARTQSTEAAAIFKQVGESVHSVFVSVLGYAGSRDSNALEDLKQRTEDVSRARQAHRELEDYLARG